MKHVRKLTAILLTVLMLLSVLAGCSKDPVQNDDSSKPDNNQQTDQNQTPAPGTMIYQATFKDLTMDYELNWISSFCVSGDVMYFGGNCLTGKAPLLNEITGEPYIDEITGEPMEMDTYEMVMFALDLKTGTVSVLENFQPAQIPEGLLGSTYMNFMASGLDGTIWTMEEMYTYSFDFPEDFDINADGADSEYYEYYTPGENKYIFSNLDSTGKLIHRFELSADDGFYPSALQVDAEGRLYIGSSDKTVVMNADGSETLFTLGDEETYGELISLGADKIGIVTYDYENGGRYFNPIDPVAKGLGTPMEMPENIGRTYPGFGDYAFLYDNYSDTVFGYRSDNGESEKLFSWMDCDISRDYINNFTVLDDGTVIALSKDYSQDNAAYELVELKKVDASTVPQKKQLTLACMWMGSDMRAEVIKFNKSNSDIRINVVDYSQYNTNDDPTGGVTRLNTEILSDNIPDIIMTDDLPINRYAAKGLLVDLWTLIDEDGELSRDDLMTHFFEAVSVDGKLYEIFQNFTIQTTVANGNYVGDRSAWTLEEMRQVLATLEPNAYIASEYLTKSDILSICVNRSLDSFINWETMQCSFDSDAFIEILEFANSFALEYNWEDYDYDTTESEYMRMLNGRQLMMEYYIGSFDDIQYAVTNAGPNPVFVGFPSSNGTGSTFSCYNGLAITSSCSDLDAAWKFVRTFLTEEHQRMEYYSQFPTNRVCFEEYAAQKMTQEYEKDLETGEFLLDENGNKIPISNGGWMLEDGTEFAIYAMTQSQYDSFMRLYESCGSSSSFNQEISELITSEVEMYFHGEKTAEATAAAIQNKVSLYLMEQN